MCHHITEDNRELEKLTYYLTSISLAAQSDSDTGIQLRNTLCLTASLLNSRNQIETRSC